MVPLVKMVNIWKRFGAVEAVRGANLDIHAGEVVGLVGDNGAGKSTLMKILAGLYPPDEGEIYFNGERVAFRSVADARSLGIEMIFQNLALARQQTVAENIFLGREPKKMLLRGAIRIIDYKRMNIEARKILQMLEISIDVGRTVKWLSGGQQQAVAIARAFSVNRSPRLIIMDEPTAALAVKEVQKVLQLIRNLKANGVAVILISHRLPDVLEVSDRVIVMRQGQTIANLPASTITIDDVVKLIIGGDSNVNHADIKPTS
ncbi:MAG: ATP-binding cassette domain-containing protein [Nanopusillaceae archaeon]